MGQIITK